VFLSRGRAARQAGLLPVTVLSYKPVARFLNVEMDGTPRFGTGSEAMVIDLSVRFHCIAAWTALGHLEC